MKNVRLDEAGFVELLTSGPIEALMQQAADLVGSHAEGHVTRNGEAVEVWTGTYTTDRANGVVTLAHPAGLAIEAEHGLLARALGAEGLALKGGA